MSTGLLWRGSVSLVTGRLSLSVGRLLICVIVARLAGVQALAELVLLLSLIAVAEWVADFGQADISVREIGKGAVAQAPALAALRRAKIFNGLAAALLPVAALLAMGHYGLAAAGLIAGAGILLYAALQPVRVAARHALRPDRDMAAELAGFLCWLALAWPATRLSDPMAGLAIGYAISRAVHWALLARLQPAPVGQAAPGAARTLMLTAAPLGVMGLMVALYDNIAPILLALLSDQQSVAQYGVAARFAFPALIVVQAINTAFFPLLASAGEELGRIQQWSLETSLAVAGLIFAGVHGAAGFLFTLVSPDLPPAMPLLQLLAWLVLLRAATTSMAALVVIGGRQAQGMWLTLTALACQTAAIVLLVPRFGIMAIAWSYIIIELVLSLGPVSWLGLRATGARLQPMRPLLLVASAGAIASAIALTPIAGSFAAGILGALLFAIAISFICPQGINGLRTFIRTRAAGAAS